MEVDFDQSHHSFKNNRKVQPKKAANPVLALTPTTPSPKRTQDILNRFELVFYYLILTLFILLSLLHLFTGYADNGDFARNAELFFDGPDGFSSMWPTPDSEEWNRRFFSEWHDKWVFLPAWPIIEPFFLGSSYKLYLLIQASLSQLMTGGGSYYSITLGSVLSRLILFSTYLALTQHIRNHQPKASAWAFMITAGLILTDSSWIAFLNSFYEEQIAIIFLPILGYLFLKFRTIQDIKTGLLLLACATFIGSSKTAYFYLPTLCLLCLAPLISSQKKLVALIFFTALMQTISLLPVHFGKYERINSYHVLYYGALHALTQEDALSIASIGEKPIIHECIGVSAFNQEGAKCMEAANASYMDVIKLICSHPEAGLRMLIKLFQEAHSTEINEIGKHMKNTPGYSGSIIFNIWPKLFALGLNYLVLLILLMCLAGGLVKKSLINHRERTVLLTGLFFAVFGFSQYIASLGDGFWEITKHLAAGNYSLALSLPFIFAAFASVASRQLEKAAK